MRRLLPLVLLCSLATAARAAGFEAGIRHVVSIPMASQESGAGELDIPLSRGFAVTGETYLSPRASVMASIAFLNPEAILYPASGDPSDVDLGTLGMEVYSVTGRWQFVRKGRWSAFGGAGPAFVRFGNLDDRFGEAILATVHNETTFAAEGGVRFQFRPRLAFEVSAAWLPLEGDVEVQQSSDPRVTLPSSVALDPVIVSIGASWRF
jgi:hypothetical protein